MPIKLLDLEPQRRDTILNAALKEFALRGFDNASTNVIAKEARISKALMFHYINSKQELFLFVCNYFTDLLDKEYFKLMDFSVKDVFDRLRQSYLLQIDLLKKYPWIFEFSKLKEKANQRQSFCYEQIFDKIDEAKFRAGLDVEKCKQIILWSSIGFTSQILDEIKKSETSNPDYNLIIVKLEKYFEELKRIFY